MTRAKARILATNPRESWERVAEHDRPGEDRDRVGGDGGHRDHGNGLADLQALGRDGQTDERGNDDRQHQWADEDRDPTLSPKTPVWALIAVSETAQKRPADAPRADPRVPRAPADHGDPDRQRRDEDQECRERGERVVGVGSASGALQRGGEKGQPERRQPDADPLATGDLMGEEPVGDHGEQDEPPRDDRLDQRDRGERERSDVEAPGSDRDHDAEHVPAVPEQGERGPYRPVPLDRRRADRTLVLEEEADGAKNAVATAIASPI